MIDWLKVKVWARIAVALRLNTTIKLKNGYIKLERITKGERK